MAGTKKIFFLLCFWAFCCVHICGQTRESDMEKVRIAARLDAMRQLAQMVENIRISHSITVKDYIADNDGLKRSFSNLIQSAQDTSTPVYKQDGTCEVTMEITFPKVVHWVKNSYMEHANRKITLNDIQKMSQSNYTMLRARGTGSLSSKEYPNNIWDRVGPRGKLMALRAAKVDAYRNLAEAIQGIRIVSTTTVKDFITENDEIRSEFHGFLRGAEFVGNPVYLLDGTVEVKARIETRQLISCLSEICRKHYHGTRWTSETFDGLCKQPFVYAVGIGIPPAQYIQPAHAKAYGKE